MDLVEFWKPLGPKPSQYYIYYNERRYIVIEDHRPIIFFISSKKQIFAVPKTKCRFNRERGWIVTCPECVHFVNCQNTPINNEKNDLSQIYRDITNAAPQLYGVS